MIMGLNIAAVEFRWRRLEFFFLSTVASIVSFVSFILSPLFLLFVFLFFLVLSSLSLFFCIIRRRTVLFRHLPTCSKATFQLNRRSSVRNKKPTLALDRKGCGGCLSQFCSFGDTLQRDGEVTTAVFFLSMHLLRSLHRHHPHLIGFMINPGQ